MDRCRTYTEEANHDQNVGEQKMGTLSEGVHVKSSCEESRSGEFSRRGKDKSEAIIMVP